MERTDGGVRREAKGGQRSRENVTPTRTDAQTTFFLLPPPLRALNASDGLWGAETGTALKKGDPPGTAELK